MSDDPNPSTLHFRGLTVKEAAQKLRVSEATVKRWCKAGYLEAQKYGARLWLIEPRAVANMKRCPHCRQPLPDGLVK